MDFQCGSFSQEHSATLAQRMLYRKASPEFRLKPGKKRRRLAMKITYMTAAHGLLFVAACLPAAAQTEVNPDHFPDESAPIVQASKPEPEINVLRQKLEGYEQQLRAQREQVE